MEINESLVEKAPLTEYEKDLIRLIDVKGIEATSVASKKGKDKSTISIQHKKAMEKLQKFMAEMKYEEASGELASKVFTEFDNHVQLTEVVRKYKIAPKVVRALYKEWISLKEEDLNSPSVPKRLKEIEEKWKSIGYHLSAELERYGYRNGPDELEILEFLNSAPELLKLKNLRCLTDSMYEKFHCDGCDSKHYFAIRAQCTNCKEETWWGYQPKATLS